jgi:FkbM family methyltransferase
MKLFLHYLLNKFNLKLTKFTTYQRSKVINFLNTIKNKRKLDNTNKCLPYFRSQFGQDLFVLNELNFKKNGFFVEFGATDGISGSNTYLLENKFNWRGILAEPAKTFYSELIKNRKCFIENNLVWKNSKSKLLFHEDFARGLSTIKKFINHDTQIRKKNKEYILESISLNDLLKKFNAPKIIDYLSIDTEGSEFDILNNFNFNKYKFRIITCEHNFTPNKNKIHKLLTKNGYVKKHSSLVSFVDDWYVYSF